MLVRFGHGQKCATNHTTTGFCANTYVRSHRDGCAPHARDGILRLPREILRENVPKITQNWVSNQIRGTGACVGKQNGQSVEGNALPIAESCEIHQHRRTTCGSIAVQLCATVEVSSKRLIPGWVNHNQNSSPQFEGITSPNSEGARPPTLSW